MYQDYYQFNEKPFSLTPDPKFLYPSAGHREALDHLVYGIRQREGFMLLVGGVGTGKTTLCRSLLERFDPEVKSALVVDSLGSEMDLLRTCVSDLGARRARARNGQTALALAPAIIGGAFEDAPPLEEEEEDAGWIARASKKELTDALSEFLIEQYRQGGTTVLIVDEAQNLSLPVLEQLRLLSNLETEKDKLLQIILVGHLEFARKLNSPELKQLNERISIRCTLAPLTREELYEYILHRVLIAGAGGRIVFAPCGLSEIYHYSKGVPRRINLVCDRALLAGFNAQTGVLERTHVRQAVSSLSGEEGVSMADSFPPFRLTGVLGVLVLLAALALFVLPQKFAEKQWRFMGTATDVESVPGEMPPATESLETGDEASRLTRTASAGKPFPVVSPQPAAGGYRIRVSTMRDAAQAEKQVEKLIEEGYPAFWKKAFSSRRDWYIVYAGPYDTVKPARIHLNALKFSGWHPILLSFTSSD